MKAFETPFVDVKKFDLKDVLTTSAGETEAPTTPPCPENTLTPCFDD